MMAEYSAVPTDDSFDPRWAEAEPEVKKETKKGEVVKNPCWLCGADDVPVRLQLSSSYFLRCIDCDQSRTDVILNCDWYNNDLKCGKCEQYGSAKWYRNRYMCYGCKPVIIPIIFKKGWEIDTPTVRGKTGVDINKSIAVCFRYTTAIDYYKNSEIESAIVKFGDKSVFVSDLSKTFADVGVTENTMSITIVAYRKGEKHISGGKN